jgi:hypothetical protein
MSVYGIANAIGFNSLGFSPNSISNLQLWHDATDVGTQGYSLDFDGVDDYAVASNEITAYPFTFESWVKIDTIVGALTFLSINDSANGSRYFLIDTSSAKFRITARNTTSTVTTGTTTIVANTWYHLAGVFASATDRRLYLNGVLEASDTSSVTFTNVITNQVLFGLQRTLTPNNYLDGKLSDVRIWNTARTETEILDNYNKRLIGNETGLVGYWKLSEGISAVAKDFTSNANDATITEAVWIVDEPFSNGVISDYTSMRIWKDKSGNGYDATQATSANRPTYRTNQVNGKPTINFDGSNDVLLSPSGAFGILRNVSGASIFVVYKASTDLTIQAPILITTNASTIRLDLRKNASNLLATSGRTLDADTAESIASTTTNVGNYILQSVKYDYQNTLQEQYLNNTLEGQNLTFQTSGNTSDTNSAYISIGAFATSNYLNGAIAEIIVFNKTLSTAEFNNVNKYLMAKWGL